MSNNADYLLLTKDVPSELRSEFEALAASRGLQPGDLLRESVENFQTSDHADHIQG